jgi:hypothetical protein
MRIFYVYTINEIYKDMYYDNSYRLYKILEGIYYQRDYSKISSYMQYKQVVSGINKMLCNGYITKNHRLAYEYGYDNNCHYIRKKDEHTKMIISNIYIKIISDLNFPCFFNDLYSYEKNIFICDFDNKDYFWLDKVMKKNRQNDLIIVK